MFIRPGITQLRDQAIADILAALGFPTLLRRSPLRALAYSQAGLAQGQYQYLDWIARQAVPFTATGVFLEAWAALVGVIRKPATAATGYALVTFAAAATLSIGAVLRRGDGLSFVTTASVTRTSAGTATVPIQAAGTGSAYTIDDGDALVLSSTVANIQSGATGTHDVAGADPEMDAPFRTRMLLTWAQRPQGGSEPDYIEWALAVPGVTRAWITRDGFGPGTVVLYTMWDDAEVGHNGIPQGYDGVSLSEYRDSINVASGDQRAVADALYSLQPATALLYSVAPVADLVPVAIWPASTIPAATMAAVPGALRDALRAAAAPGGTIEPSLFYQALSALDGMPEFDLLAPSTPVGSAAGHIAVLGAVTIESGPLALDGGSLDGGGAGSTTIDGGIF